MILLAEHDEPSLAAKKKQQHVALETATSTPKNRVWNFFDRPLGRPGGDTDLSLENATGSVQYSYETASGQAYYYTSDHLDSTREVCNSSGTIVARYGYDAYGRTTLLSGTNIATFQYAGMQMHQTSGLYLTDYRAYDSTTGRWLSRDPDGEIETDAEDDDGGDDGTVGGMNLYGYVGNNSPNYYDDDGLGHKKTKQSTGKFKGSKKERHQKGQSRPKAGARPGRIKPNMDQNQRTFCPIPSPGPLPAPTQPSPVPPMPAPSPDGNPSPVYTPIYTPIYIPTPTKTQVTTTVVVVVVGGGGSYLIYLYFAPLIFL